MPWSIENRDGQYCVVKDGDGSTVKCHASRADAVKHQRALYANEPSARTASLSAVAPLKPPRAWFEFPELAEHTPITITADGQVYGHLYRWGDCHAGFPNECVMAPRSASGYAFFHLGQLETAEGDMIAVGKLTYGGPHAPLSSGLQAASQHYDNTGSVGAFVRARDGDVGIWLSGAVRSDISPEGLRDLRANPPSGDWRVFKHSLELVAALAVPVPGYPVPREMALAASGEVMSLIMSSDDAEPRSREFIRQRSLISSSLEDA